ncbi:hypothetical protein POSPLADRAFT_1065586 [Postia placenta MAD-698-R-SB12]|uniref:MMS19 nucleotide excision repair protein n=1 Tax=Postia placenta MAD-698-R-SB12 TaxID=670580 RepID=A0A1X6N7I3_9APHY|nr:hypothetical protein POSPLADRAFT_1065586 [Postia placenta MAD-698-R-SB12]OSX64436.1 hypothetical protein POSPLADRAFT_1065586 [Postia placenta MAD-698-R-SB12]
MVLTCVSEIANGSTSLLDLVKALGEYLTAEEDDLRSKGVDFLSLVIGKCPPEKFSRQSVRVLVTFYCGKLEDTETIIPALRGLVPLMSLSPVTSADAVEVTKAVIKHVKMKALVQSQRYLVFKTIDTLIANQRDALKAMGKEFISGYISLAEGEKDPRNLLLAFAIDRVMVLEFDISTHVEDLFNVTFCYFPITFRPPPDDPYGITTDDLKNALREPALGLLVTIAEFAPSHVTQTTLPLLFVSLPDRAPPRDAQAERIRCWRTLDSLSRLCKQADLFETLVVRLLTKLDLVCVPPADGALAQDETDIEPRAAYAHSILRTMADVLAAKVAAGHSDVTKYADRLVPRVFNLFIYAALVSNGRYMAATDPRLVSVASQIVTLVVQTLSPQRQEAFVSVLFAGYLHGDAGKLAEGHQKLPADKKFEPFSPEVCSLQKNLLALFSAAIIALHKEVALPVPDEDAFLNTLLQWSSAHAENVLQRDAATHAISSIVNKRPGGLAVFLAETLDSFWTTQIANRAMPPPKRKEGISSWAWITKALLIRNDAAAARNIDKLLGLLDDAEVSWDAARAIGSVVATDKILTKRNHAVIKAGCSLRLALVASLIGVAQILYAQRYCSSVLPRIVEGARSSSDSQKQNAFLVALTSLIQSVPKSVYAPQMSMLMPLLLRGLDLPDTEIRAGVMDTLFAAAQSDANENGVVAEHAASLVSTMLRNSMVKEMPAAASRRNQVSRLCTYKRVGPPIYDTKLYDGGGLGSIGDKSVYDNLLMSSGGGGHHGEDYGHILFAS